MGGHTIMLLLFYEIFMSLPALIFMIIAILLARKKICWPLYAIGAGLQIAIATFLSLDPTWTFSFIFSAIVSVAAALIIIKRRKSAAFSMKRVSESPQTSTVSLCDSAEAEEEKPSVAPSVPKTSKKIGMVFAWAEMVCFSVFMIFNLIFVVPTVGVLVLYVELFPIFVVLAILSWTAYLLCGYRKRAIRTISEFYLKHPEFTSRDSSDSSSYDDHDYSDDFFEDDGDLTTALLDLACHLGTLFIEIALLILGIIIRLLPFAVIFTAESVAPLLFIRHYDKEAATLTASANAPGEDV